MAQAQPMTPAEMQASILERLTGATGDPGHLVETARSLCTRGCPAFMQALAEELGSPIEAELGDVEIVRLLDARPADDSREAVVMVASAASPDALVMSIDPDALALAVGVFFGADAEMAVAPIERDLSPTEVEIAAMVFGCFARALDGSGERGLQLRFPLPGPVSGPECKKLAFRDGPGVRMTVRLFTPAGSGKLAVTMPQRLLMKPRGEGGAANERDLGRQPEWAARFSSEIMQSAVRLEATIPMGKLTLGQIAGLAVGDVIPMPKAAATDTRLSARGKTLYVCEFGKLGDQFTVRIGERHEAGRGLMDALAAG